MIEDKKEEELVERSEPIEPEEVEEEVEPVEDDSKFDKIYSNVASNRYENLQTSYIEMRAKELRKHKK